MPKLKPTYQLLLTLTFLTLTHTQTITLDSNVTNLVEEVELRAPVKLATMPSEFDMNQNGYPWLTLEHGFNYVAFDGWTCQNGGENSALLQSWMNPKLPGKPGKTNTPNTDGQPQIDQSQMSAQFRSNMKTFASRKGVSLILNIFSSFQNPASSNLSASHCANSLSHYLTTYNYDGVNLDFRDTTAMTNGNGITWLTVFLLTLGRKINRKVFVTLDAELYDLRKYPMSNPVPIQIAIGSRVDYFVVNYDKEEKYQRYFDVFGEGEVGVKGLVSRGMKNDKIVVGKSADFNSKGFVYGREMGQWLRTALAANGWSTGLSVSAYNWNKGLSHLDEAIHNKDPTQPIIGATLSTVKNWWPPQKTAADIGVPGYAAQNIYNYFSLSVWTCRKGSFDAARLWQDANFFMPEVFGHSDAQIQSYFKKRYMSKGKKIVVKAFGDAQAPTTAKIDPIQCALSLSSFVKENQLDGVEVHYKDNEAFNAGTAQSWLIIFTKKLRAELPFHLISHTIQLHYLNTANYPSGGYEKVINSVDQWLDFYVVEYYGHYGTEFNNFQRMFVNSGEEIVESSVFQLLVKGFRLNKIVIGKSANLLQTPGVGYVPPSLLRQVFLKGNKAYGWRGGLLYSSYLDDSSGSAALKVMRGMDNSSPIILSYVNNLKTWWPPEQTLAEMGVPTHAQRNIYNYFAYAFWTCREPLAIVKMYGNLTGFIGTGFGADNAETQRYVRSKYTQNGVKLLISAFGASENPTTEGYDPVQCASNFSSFVRQNQVDGVDIDYQDSEAFHNSTGEDWVITFMRKLRSELPFHIISHAPQGPYFSPIFSPKGAYREIDKLIGNTIDFYNVQFYNQGNTTYDTYQQLFVQSDPRNPETTLYQLLDFSDVDPGKIVLGKPVTQSDAYNTGYVQPGKLNEMLRRSREDVRNKGWKPSVMFWHYLSDLKGEIVNKTMEGLL